MKTLKPYIAALSALLAALLLYFAYRYGRQAGAKPAPPVPAAAVSKPAVIKKTIPARRRASPGGNTAKAAPELTRPKRVSSLGEPGESLIGGVSSAAAKADPKAAASDK